MKYSVLRYPGGKTRAIKELKKYIPKGTTKIVSPFYGGGSFENYLSYNGYDVKAYDKYYPLVCFWRELKNNKKNLIAEIRKHHPLSKDQFIKIRSKLTTEQNSLKSAAFFYVLNRASFSGSTSSGGMSIDHPRFNEKQISELLSFDIKINVEHKDFKEVIPATKEFIYADPPYMVKERLYGHNGSMHKNFDHILLSKQLKRHGNFMLCYNNCDEVKSLYEGYKFIYPEWAYGMSKNKKSNEILIIGD